MIIYFSRSFEPSHLKTLIYLWQPFLNYYIRIRIQSSSSLHIAGPTLNHIPNTHKYSKFAFPPSVTWLKLFKVGALFTGLGKNLSFGDFQGSSTGQS